MPIDPQLVEEKEQIDPRDIQINQLKAEIESNKKQEEDRNREMESRIKQLLLELSKEKQDKNICESKWMGIFLRIRQFLIKINKYIRRSYVDLQFCLNNIVLQAKNNEVVIVNDSSKETVQNTLKNI